MIQNLISKIITNLDETGPQIIAHNLDTIKNTTFGVTNMTEAVLSVEEKDTCFTTVQTKKL